jgi:uncharacterized membrane protein (DUF373 family)
METARDTTPMVSDRWARMFKMVELVVVLFLMALLIVVVAISAVELAWLLFRDLSSVRVLVLDAEEMFELFGFFLFVLIGLELFTALKSHVLGGVFQVEVVLEVALIAIAQKLIILDTSRSTGTSLLGLAALVLALAGAFWLVHVARARRGAVRAPWSSASQ